MVRRISAASVALLAGAAACGICLLAPPARAAHEAQAAATRDYALKALAFYRSSGFAAAKAEFMAPEKWLLGPEQFNLHIAGLSSDQMIWADSAFPEVIGLSYADVADLDGVPLARTVWGGLAKSPDGAAVQLRFADPVSRTIAHAEGYCVPADAGNVICAWSEVTN